MSSQERFRIGDIVAFGDIVGTVTVIDDQFIGIDSDEHRTYIDSSELGDVKLVGRLFSQLVQDQSFMQWVSANS